MNPRRPWDAAFALSPALALSGLINWDLIAVALTAGALWAWARERPVLTGVLIGLGTAAKLYPLFLLGGLLVICLREQRLRRFAAATLAAAAAWGLANLPAYVSGRDQWEVFWTFNSARGADLGSIWLVIEQASNSDFAAHSINVWSWLIFGAWCVGVLVLGLRAPETPRLAQLGFLIVAGFLLVNKVYSPQYVLWLLPLAVLAGPAGVTRSSGRRARSSLRCRVVVPRRLPRRRRSPGRRLLLGGDPAADGRRALPGRDRGPRRAGAPARPGAPASGDDDAVEGRRCVADADIDRVADGGHTGTLWQEQHRGLHVRGLREEALPSIENGDRTKPTASRPPRARVAARARIDDSPVGASRPIPCAVPPVTTRRCPVLGAVRAR